MNDEIKNQLLNSQFTPDKSDAFIGFKIPSREKFMVESVVHAYGFKNVSSYFLALHRVFSGEILKVDEKVFSESLK